MLTRYCKHFPGGCNSLLNIEKMTKMHVGLSAEREIIYHADLKSLKMNPARAWLAEECPSQILDMVFWKKFSLPIKLVEICFNISTLARSCMLPFVAS